MFFDQTRAGLDGQPFQMHKFRTMVADAEERSPTWSGSRSCREPMFKLSDDPRVTRVGRFLRRLSLDELPQLWNVLRGEMSLVGPRPEQVELVERYRPEHRFRLSVKPGITGPMQVFGRGELTFHERLAVELDYIENLSLGRDLRIIAETVPVTLRGVRRAPEPPADERHGSATVIVPTRRRRACSSGCSARWRLRRSVRDDRRRQRLRRLGRLDLAPPTPGVEVLRLETNRATRGRSTSAPAAQRANGLVLLNDDCVVDPGFVEAIIAPLDPAAGVVMAAGGDARLGGPRG